MPVLFLLRVLCCMHIIELLATVVKASSEQQKLFKEQQEEIRHRRLEVLKQKQADISRKGKRKGYRKRILQDQLLSWDFGQHLKRLSRMWRE